MRRRVVRHHALRLDRQQLGHVALLAQPDTWPSIAMDGSARHVPSMHSACTVHADTHHTSASTKRTVPTPAGVVLPVVAHAADEAILLVEAAPKRSARPVRRPARAHAAVELADKCRTVAQIAQHLRQQRRLGREDRLPT